ncbi:presenilin family protein [Heterostelium album PN500]|uniref:Presenilin family protein n=1 Tax=Heterostelium pallidum (strain ATCC 26659 / Pp 5 / PN500) TaxID=670386 RepID=D3B5F5_HETP5|nr:presenilin family protein [Heterostelium album PN500]EFA83103.1 presenilin family protein [Heterostelium album PN500]|eukprot:XP_020435220.1 presenilin family protein [Heterostelium album PN500]
MSPKDKNEKSSPTPLEINNNNIENNSNNNNNIPTPKLLVNDIVININSNSNNKSNKNSNNNNSIKKNNEYIDSDSDSDIEIQCKSSVLFVSPKLTPVNNNSSSSSNFSDKTQPSPPIQITSDESTSDSDSEFEMAENEELEPPCIIDYSDQMVSIAIPVFFTMVVVTAVIRAISVPDNQSSPPPANRIDIPAGFKYDTDPNIQQVFLNTLINSLIFLGVVVLSTVIMVILYKFKFMKALYGWLMATSILLLGVFGGFLFILILTYVNIALDYLTFVFVVWNFSAGGIVCIFWFCPKYLNQAYLICLSAFLALFLARFPSWTTWAILVLVSIYDIFAVLCPGGPLQQLIETARKRGESIPALIYNASVFIGMAESESIEMNTTTTATQQQLLQNNTNNSQKPSPFPTPTSIPINLPSQSEMIEPKSSPNSESMSTGVSTSELSESTDSVTLEKGRGIKLGLGDFVFYSVLVGRAAYKEIILVFICFVAILTGLFITLLLLAVYKRALPALPIKMKFNKLLLVSILLIVHLFHKTNAFTITRISERLGYTDGGNLFRIESPDFPVLLPTLKVINGNKEAVFAYRGLVATNIYEWVVPAKPMDLTILKKRGRDNNDQQVRLHIILANTPNPLYQYDFNYVTPVIDDFKPKSNYLHQAGTSVTISGNYFKLHDYDTDPEVRFDGVQAVVTSASGFKIICVAPTAVAVNDLVLKVRLATGKEIKADFLFQNIMPIVDDVSPNKAVSQVSKNIKIYGKEDSIIPEADQPATTIAIGGQPCTNVRFLQKGVISCDTPLLTVAAGLSTPFDITIQIRATVFTHVPKFIVYTPVISNFLPKFSLAAGGTRVVVSGRHLNDIDAIRIGDSNCVVDYNSYNKDANTEVESISCTAASCDMGGLSEKVNNFNVIVDGQIFNAGLNPTFTYYVPAIKSIEPESITEAIRKSIVIRANYVNSVTKVTIGGVDHIPSSVLHNNMIIVEINAASYQPGSYDVTVVAENILTNKLNLDIGPPDIIDLNIKKGFINSYTPVTFRVRSFPVVPLEDMDTVIAFKIGTQFCEYLERTSNTEYTCSVPPKGIVSTDLISLVINGVEKITGFGFSYAIPTVTGQTQSSNIPMGGGNLVIDGLGLNFVTSIKFATSEIKISSCAVNGEVKITCPIPRFKVGNYPVSLVVNINGVDYSYLTGQSLAYVGPSLTSVRPSQSTKERAHVITLTGTGFGTSAALISINIGATACTNIVIINNNANVSCSIAKLAFGTYPVTITVQPNVLSAGVVSSDTVTYSSTKLSCLGPALPDKTNNPVDWWFIYKIKGELDEYLYIDSTMDRFQRHRDLQNHGDTASMMTPMEATFKVSYANYYFMFFNDQPNSRTDQGKRGKSDSGFTSMRKNSDGKSAHGHFKTMVFFDDPDPATNLSPGIHIAHSNPAFPSNKNANAYNGPADGIKFLGAADFNQHFFCYAFDNIETAMEYVIKNDGNLQSEIHLFPNVAGWNQAEMNRYPYFYDYVSHYLNYPARVPAVNTPPRKTPVDFIKACDSIVANIAGQTLENIGNSYSDNRSPFKDLSSAQLNQISQFVVWKEKKIDGIDIWLVVADTLRKKYFVEFFFAMSSVQMKVTEKILNVACFDLPPNYAKLDGSTIFTDYHFSGRKKEHAKMGFPVYPTFGANALGPNENYFCVGDSNRHNGQGYRGGGVICIQNPYLVYFFNRMVRQYNTMDINNVITDKIDSIGLFYGVTQPIKVNRGAWTKTFEVEVKDYINGNHYSKLPKEIYPILASTRTAATDVNAKFNALRTRKTHAVGVNGERSVVPVPPTLPNEPDILNYVSNDLLSLHYIGYDQTVGAICDYDAAATECTKAIARTTIIPTLPNYVRPIFPTVYEHVYAGAQPLVTYDLTQNDHFKLIKFTSEFITKLPNAKRNFYQFQIAPVPALANPQFRPPFIIRQADAVCEEEVAYFMTLHYIYYQSGALDPALLIYKIGTDAPNWANGVILAISKKLYSELRPSLTPAVFNGCMNNIFPDFPNIDTYREINYDMANPSNDKLVRRSAGAAWDWMETSYTNGYGGKIDRVNNDQRILVADLLEAMIKARQNGRILTMKNLLRFINRKYIPGENFDAILVNNYIIPRPLPVLRPLQMLFMMNPSSFSHSQSLLTSSNSTNPLGQRPFIVQDERSLQPGVQQLFSVPSSSINSTDILSLTAYQIQKLELSFDKWINVNGQSQAIQTLILDPTNQVNNQPILFIDELNRDFDGNAVDLKYQDIGSTGTRATIASPLSIVSITFFLESIIISKSISKSQFGDFEVYYLPKKSNYNGVISSDLNGMIISTLNSQLCDIQMNSESNFLSNNFDTICSGIGPVITSVNQLSGSTNGGYMITVSGIRFNSTMTILIGTNECDSTQFISSSKLACQVPKGVGKNNDILLSTPQMIFNLQRTKYLFNYDSPIITSVQPDIINSYGSDLMTIYGSNFGDDVTNVKVLIDERLDCSPIVSLTSDSVACLTPSAIGDHRSITVIVKDQSTKLNLNTLETQSFSFSGPQILSFIPSSGDPTDRIRILGDGFGHEEDSDLPPILFIGDNMVEITNFTNQFIEFQLEYENTNQPLIIQSGDQSIQTEFTYYPPLVTFINNSIVSTSGGLIQLGGYGLSLASNDFNFKLNSQDIDCNPFDLFIECFVPPGIGSNYLLSATQSSGESIEFVENFTISYSAPKITSHILLDSSIQIIGSNFVPLEYGLSFNTSTSFIRLNYQDIHYDDCTTFESSKLAVCNSKLNMNELRSWLNVLF